MSEGATGGGARGRLSGMENCRGVGGRESRG